ncbi:tyrosinase family protein [Daejeonella oryzae]|uniref:tyrosinase family protein n=1 Tax=Daejeonella oryzae TaxID=1122943 RepID=UPI000422D754|nr:tyrosinase family protein [Daejeonella oryzae]
MKIRKNALYLTTAERNNFLEAVLILKNTIANPGAPSAQQINIYDQFVAIHNYVVNLIVPGSATPVNVGHGNAGFCSWHRYYILRFEQALQNAAGDPSIMLPYWDWTDQTGTQNILFQNNFMGPNGGAGGVGGGSVMSGFFAFNAPAMLPPWWPAGLPGWRIRPALTTGSTTLRRNLGAFPTLPLQTDVNNLLSKTDYEPAAQFRSTLETAPLHNFIHGWVGGSMVPSTSPNDPIFFLHHCNVDRLWAMWQIDGHQGAAFYPAAGEPVGHNLNDPLWPWVGALPGYAPAAPLADIVLPNFTAEPQITSASVLNHHALGYAYDVEPVIGIALDQTGSMLGMTPDPLTGMAPNISKWTAAKQGVSFFLQDCQTAYTAREAYVTAGVETFRSLAGNQFTKIFSPGTPYGLIKNGTSFSRATFDANIAAQLPSGGTPIAGAITDTETTLVRPPFSNQPSNQQRYMAILTDGIETSAPLLNTIPNGSLNKTIIFGMGFGIGGGWNGVDYATLASIVLKGKTDPGVPTQVFHGENAAVIDKFYTDSLANSMGYTPALDPIFDLFPGEHLHFTFDITSADNSFMIVAQGYDFSSKNWNFCLMGPDGISCCCDTGMDEHVHEEKDEEHEHTNHDVIKQPLKHEGHDHEKEKTEHEHAIDCPYFLTKTFKDGRFTAFVNRNGTPTEKWAGKWTLMAHYRHGQNDEVMIMPHIQDLLLPISAPPLKGPLYSRYNQPVNNRPVSRIIPGKLNHRLAGGLAAPSTQNINDPCAVSIQIYHKTTFKPKLTIRNSTLFTGDDIVIHLDLNTPEVLNTKEVISVARLIAPLFSAGNFFADRETIPMDRREKYYDKELQPPFNELSYLADYENLKPGVFKLRDEEIIFQRGTGSSLQARISNNIYPGIYHLSVYLEGLIDFPYPDCCQDHPQVFSRVFHTQVVIGIRPDANRSKPILFWKYPNAFVLSLTPTDKYGNVISPVRTPAPLVKINGQAVTGSFENMYNGELRVSFTTDCEKTPIDEHGQYFSENTSILSDQKRIEIKAGKRFRVEITIGSTTMRVNLPAIIGDRNSKIAYPAGSEQAQNLNLEDRVVFYSEKSAIKAGYNLG